MAFTIQVFTRFVESFIAHMILIRAAGGTRRGLAPIERLRENKIAQVVKIFCVCLITNGLFKEPGLDFCFICHIMTHFRAGAFETRRLSALSESSKLFHSSLRCSPVCRSDVRALWTWQILSAMVYTNVRPQYIRTTQHKVPKQSRRYYVVRVEKQKQEIRRGS